MSKIRSAFENGKAFIPFITCGDPNLETTAKIVREAVANGADLIELGIPFSDPTAEGPVIQGANIKALTAQKSLSVHVRKSELTDLSCLISHMRKRKSFYHSARNMTWISFHLSHLHQRIVLR